MRLRPSAAPQPRACRLVPVTSPSTRLRGGGSPGRANRGRPSRGSKAPSRRPARTGSPMTAAPTPLPVRPDRPGRRGRCQPSGGGRMLGALAGRRGLGGAGARGAQRSRKQHMRTRGGGGVRLGGCRRDDPRPHPPHSCHHSARPLLPGRAAALAQRPSRPARQQQRAAAPMHRLCAALVAWVRLQSNAPATDGGPRRVGDTQLRIVLHARDHGKKQLL